jgi:hypothetical protein
VKADSLLLLVVVSYTFGGWGLRCEFGEDEDERLRGWMDVLSFSGRLVDVFRTRGFKMRTSSAVSICLSFRLDQSCNQSNSGEKLIGIPFELFFIRFRRMSRGRQVRDSPEVTRIAIVARLGNFDARIKAFELAIANISITKTQTSLLLLNSCP